MLLMRILFRHTAILFPFLRGLGRYIEYKILNDEGRLDKEFVSNCIVCQLIILGRVISPDPSCRPPLNILTVKVHCVIWLRWRILYIAYEVYIWNKIITLLLFREVLCRLLLQARSKILFVFSYLIIAEKVSSLRMSKSCASVLIVYTAWEKLCWRFVVPCPNDWAILLYILLVFELLVPHWSILLGRKYVVVGILILTWIVIYHSLAWKGLGWYDILVVCCLC